MFACFGSKNKSKSKSKTNKSKENNSNSNSDDENNPNNAKKSKQLNEEYVKLKIKCETLQYQNETMQRESMFLDSLIREYKVNLHYFEKESGNDNDSHNSEYNIENFLKSEADILQAKLELLTSDNNILQGQFIETYNELEQLSNPESSDKAKLEIKKFLIENIKLKKQSTLDYLTNKLNALKKNKKGKGNNMKLLIDDIFFNNNEPSNGLDGINMRKVKDDNNNYKGNGDYKSSSFDSDSESRGGGGGGGNNYNRGFYSEDPNRELIRKVLSETLEHSRASYQKIYKANIDENAKFDEISKKIEEIKKEIESIKNPQSANAISTEAKSQPYKNPENKESKEHKELKEKKEELQKNKAMISNLLKEIEKTKSENDSLEKKILESYNVLSNAFSTSVKLEKELEKIRSMKSK